MEIIEKRLKPYSITDTFDYAKKTIAKSGDKNRYNRSLDEDIVEPRASTSDPAMR